MTQLLGYARVSTADQAPELQLDELRAAGCERIWTDHATGTRGERPQLARVLEHMRSGDTLVVWRLDRLARSLSDLIALGRRLEQAGVGLRSLREQIDTTTPGGRLIFHVFGTLAEFEADLIRERTHAGLAAARARGRRGGRKPALTPAKIDAARQMHAARHTPSTRSPKPSALAARASTVHSPSPLAPPRHQASNYLMTDNAVVLLDTLLAERDRLRGGEPLPDDEAFELFAFEQCLKEDDLSEEEIAPGLGGRVASR